MVVEPPSWHPVTSWGGCGRNAAHTPLWGEGVSVYFLILRSGGCILGNFWLIWFSVFALLRKAFAG